VNVFPIQAPPEGVGTTCPSCGASVVADQRYCLKCGQSCSPLRLAFLDVLQAEGELHASDASAGYRSAGLVSIVSASADHSSTIRDEGAIGWLRRYSGLFGLLAVLLVTGLIGLLVGHWMAPSKAAGPQVVKIEGAALPAAATTTATGASTTAASPSAASTPSAKAATTSGAAGEAQEKQEVKEAEAPKAKQPPPVKTSSSSLKKLEKLTGKQHQHAIEALTAGGKPIETGG
jgi:hypothetical protein